MTAPLATQLNTATRDRLGRPLRDLRISITDRCNFRCTYCMPKEVFGKDYQFLERSALLSFEEITRLARAFTQHGVEKIRLTGGEPLIRRNIEQLITMLAEIPGLDLTLTTNGSSLARKAASLKAAGLKRITVSLDSLDDAVFMGMNDVDFPVAKVLEGIDAAAAAGLAPIKINMVVKRGVNEHSILPMARFFKEKGHILRFIEFMDVGHTNGWRMDDVVTAREIVDAINKEMPLEPADPFQKLADIVRSPPLAVADDIESGEFEVQDTRNRSRKVAKRFLPRMAFKDGKRVDCDLLRAHDFVAEGLRDGRLTEARLEEACLRILGLKAALGLHRKPVSERIATLDEAREALASAGHVATSEEVARRSVTLVKRQDALLPIDATRYPRVVVIADYPEMILPTMPRRSYEPFFGVLREAGFVVREFDAAALPTPDDTDLAIYLVGGEATIGSTGHGLNWGRLHGGGFRGAMLHGTVTVFFSLSITTSGLGLSGSTALRRA